jgi:2-keto-4-pentenoate hydratase/2-oxohepta-3-ene-1,7-dioic acid hydratase in catechol pathway
VKLLAYSLGDSAIRPGLLTERGVVDLSAVVPRAYSPQLTMQAIIDGFESLRPTLERLAADAEAVPLASVRLRPPLPWPGKILCSTTLYGKPADAPPNPLFMTLKSADAVIGPGDSIVLPDVDAPWVFVPDVELGVVIKGPAKQVGRAGWRRAVFGYLCVIDVMARGGDPALGRDNWLAKADTLCPIGPWIATADEVPEPNRLRVRSWHNDAPGQDYSTADAEDDVPRLIEFATTVMTLYSGDVIACGTSPAGSTPLRPGDRVDAEIEGLGRLSVGVTDADRDRPRATTFEPAGREA